MTRYIPVALLITAVLFVRSADAQPAGAGDQGGADLYGTRIDLPMPAGYCRMSEEIPADRDLISLLRDINSGRNIVLAMFADCAELRSFRTGDAVLSRMGSYLAPFAAAHRTIKMSRAAFAGVVAKQLQRKDKVSAAHAEARKKVEEADANARMEENVNLGLLHRDDTGAFLGLLQNWSYEGGETTRVAVVTAMTVVRRKVISINLSAPHRGWATVERLLAAQRGNIGRLIDANRQVR